MNESNSNQSPSRAFLRKVIDAVFISASDLDAFLIDYFSDVYRRTQGLERVAKVNLFLEQIEPIDVLKNIKAHLGAGYEEVLQKKGLSPMSDSMGKAQLRQSDDVLQSSKLIIGIASDLSSDKADGDPDSNILIEISNSVRVSVESLSVTLGMSPMLVQTWLNKLEYLGFIQRMDIKGRGVRYAVTPQGTAHLRKRTKL